MRWSRSSRSLSLSPSPRARARPNPRTRKITARTMRTMRMILPTGLRSGVPAKQPGRRALSSTAPPVRQRRGTSRRVEIDEWRPVRARRSDARCRRSRAREAKSAQETANRRWRSRQAPHSLRTSGARAGSEASRRRPRRRSAAQRTRAPAATAGAGRTAEKRGEELVGVRGFEPPTPASRTQCATRLRYTPGNCLESLRTSVGN